MILTASLDPGLEYATAVWQDAQLIAAYFRPPLPGPWKLDDVIVEFPKYYEGGAPANKVIELAFSAGIQAGCMGCHPTRLPKRVPTVALPKAEIERRVRKALILPNEIEVLNMSLAHTPQSFRNNVVDAVRHGLVHHRRMLP